jgi:hypothetical protein
LTSVDQPSGDEDLDLDRGEQRRVEVADDHPPEPSRRATTDEPHRRFSFAAPSLGAVTTFDVLLWAFIAAGMVLRLSNLDAMEFKEDEFTHMLGAYRAARDPWSAPLLAGGGTNPSPGVFFYQFLAMPVHLTRDPLWVARFIALVNVVAIPALFGLVRRFFTPRVALTTTALFATMPWMIIFSRKIWNPDLVLPFLIVTLWCLFSAMERYAPWKIAALAVSVALLSQLHLSVWLALFPLVPLCLLLRPWRRPLAVAGGVLVFLATFAVTLGGRMAEFLARFVDAYGQQPDMGMSQLQLVAYNGAWSIRVPSGFGFGFLLGGGYESFMQQAIVPWTRIGFVAYAALVGAGFVYALSGMVRTSRRSFADLSDRFLLVLLLMVASAHALYFVFRVAAHPHYHVVLSLLPPLLAALFLAWIAERFRKHGAVISRTLLVGVLIANVFFTFSFIDFVREKPETIDGNYGEPYFVKQGRWTRELAEAFGRIDATDRASVESLFERRGRTT